MLKEKYLTLPCIIGPNGTTEINKRRGTNCFVCLFTFFSYCQISCQIYISRSSAYLDTIYSTSFATPPNDSEWATTAPPPANGPAASRPAIVAPPPSPRGEFTGGQSGGRKGTAASGRFTSYSESSTLFNGPSPKSDLQSADRTLYITLGTTSKISAFRSFILGTK